MTAQKSIRLISITDPAPAAGFGASRRRDTGRDMRSLHKPEGYKASAGRRPAVKRTGQAAGKNSGKARQVAAAGTARTARKTGARKADIRNNSIRKNSTRYYGRSRTLAGVRRSLSGIKSRMRTAIVVLTVMLFAIMLLGLKAPAREEGTKYYKYYTSITVGCHEDIIDIMDRYRDELHYETADDYMKEVSRINNLDYRTGDLLEVQPGDQLIVPYYSTEFR